MGEDKLNTNQFVFVALIIVICGIAIIGHNYFLEKKSKVYEDMSIVLSQEPEGVEPVANEPDASQVIDNNTNNQNTPRTANDPSGKVKKSNYTYNYIGRLKIPKIKFNRGFVKYGTSGNNVNQNIAIMGGSQYPSAKDGNFILAGHSGSGWNAFFTNIDKLRVGDMAYVTYKGTEYSYRLAKRYSDPKSDGAITIKKSTYGRQLTLVTCKRPDYKKYYLVLVFEFVKEKKM